MYKRQVLIIGGGMAYTFAKAAGGTVGDSLLEMDYLDYANKMKEKAAAKGVKPVSYTHPRHGSVMDFP